MVTLGFSPRVISRILMEYPMASWTVPPTMATIAGAAAMAKAPIPKVSVMALAAEQVEARIFRLVAGEERVQ